MLLRIEETARNKSRAAKTATPPQPPAAIHRRAPGGGLNTYRGGQFLPRALWEAEKVKAAAAAPGKITALGERLQFLRRVYEQQCDLEEQLPKTSPLRARLVGLSDVAAQMTAALDEGYADLFLLGKKAAGNLFSASADEQAAVSHLTGEEHSYLNAFAAAMRAREGVHPYASRMALYANAAREAYWLGWMLGNRNPDRRVRWVLGATEKHCQSSAAGAWNGCADLAAHGPWSIGEFIEHVWQHGAGALPQSGNLTCHGFHCQCSLEEMSDEA